MEQSLPSTTQVTIEGISHDILPGLVSALGALTNGHIVVNIHCGHPPLESMPQSETIANQVPRAVIDSEGCILNPLYYEWASVVPSAPPIPVVSKGILVREQQKASLTKSIASQTWSAIAAATSGRYPTKPDLSSGLSAYVAFREPSVGSSKPTELLMGFQAMLFGRLLSTDRELLTYVPGLGRQCLILLGIVRDNLYAEKDDSHERTET